MAPTLYAVSMDREEMDEEEFTETELAILDMLEEGRCTPAYIADEVGVSSEYVQGRLRDLRRLGLVTKVHHGLYALDTGNED